MKNRFTLESWMITNGKAGDIFYSQKLDKYLTAIASYNKRKILTERMAVVGKIGESPYCEPIVKVTLL